MIEKAFLTCALALPAIHYHATSHTQLVREIEYIKDFLNRVHPGAEVWIGPEDQKPTDPHYEKVPFTWRGMLIYIRRHHIFDQSA